MLSSLDQDMDGGIASGQRAVPCKVPVILFVSIRGHAHVGLILHACPCNGTREPITAETKGPLTTLQSPMAGGTLLAALVHGVECASWHGPVSLGAKSLVF